MFLAEIVGTFMLSAVITHVKYFHDGAGPVKAFAVGGVLTAMIR